MKIQVDYLFPCEYASTDVEGKISASGIFGGIRKAKDVSSMLFSIFAVGSFTVTDVTVTKITVQIIDPNGKAISTIDLLPKTSSTRFNIVAKFNFALSLIGTYALNILINDEAAYKKDNFFVAEAAV